MSSTGSPAELTVTDWCLRSNHSMELRELLSNRSVRQTEAYAQQPLMMWAWKIGPAIACGNTVVIKTAETTPLSALVAAELIVHAGFPPGVINIITGYGNIAGSALSRHMGVDKVAFTGSTAVGRQILKDAASSNLKKVTLELGGKSPNIVFNDANLDQAVPWIHNGIFSNMGQNCCAGSRIYVQSGIYDVFVQKLRETVQQRVIGPPEDEKTIHGAQVSKTQLDRILGYASTHCTQGGLLIQTPGTSIPAERLELRSRLEVIESIAPATSWSQPSFPAYPATWISYAKRFSGPSV